MMKKLHLHLLLVLVLLYAAARRGCCKSNVRVGYRVSLAVPSEYSAGFIGRAYLIEAAHQEAAPSFRAALSVEAAANNKYYYSCSLEVFFGDVKVWNSGHYSRFVVSEECVLELTVDGDLQLKGPTNEIGWRTGTAAQSVERLQILRNGNLVLLDALNIIKWQSFNFPTDVMLWGQRLDVATRLTSFPPNNNSNTRTSLFHYYYYSLEIQQDKVALYLNSDNSTKYSYWEFRPSKNRSINFMQLGIRGLELFNDRHRKIAHIPRDEEKILASSLHITPQSQRSEPPRFLALNNRTGNMGLFHYFPEEAKFEATFQAVNTTCDLPLACKPYGICTFSNYCSCIHLVTEEHGCGGSGEFCGTAAVKMVEVEGVSSVLRDGAKQGNVSRVECTSICLEDCKCVAAFYSDYDSECYVYGLMVGIKQVEDGGGRRGAFMVKVPKGTRGKSNPKKWVLVLVGVVDGVIIVLVFGGLIYYLIWKRKRSSDTNNTR